MKKSIILLLTTALCLAISFITAQAQTTRKKDKRNVLDYYKLAVEMMDDVKNYPRDKMTIKDLKNGYLKIEGVDFYREVALFRKDNGAAILVIAMHAFFNTDHLDAYEIYEGESGFRMFSVTKYVFPRLSNREELEIFNKKRPKGTEAATGEIPVLFELPRRGRVIRVKGYEDVIDFVKLYELHLKNDKFVIVR